MVETGAASLDGVLRTLEAGSGRLRLQGLRGASRAYLLARLLPKLSRPLLVLTPTLAEGRRFAAEMQFFLGTGTGQVQHPWDPQVVVCPGWESLPLEGIPPLPEVAARRVAALSRASHGGAFACVAPVAGVLQRTVPPAVLDAATQLIAVGDALPREDLARRLLAAGYHFVGQVEEPGEASLRGGIVDLFAPYYAQPLRIELCGDEVESIRSFDLETQRSTGRLDAAVVLPAREVIGDEAGEKRAVQRLRKRCRELGLPLSKTLGWVETLRASTRSPLRDVLYPYFYNTTVPLWDHFTSPPLVVFDEPELVEERLEQFTGEIETGHRRALERGQVVPSPAEAFVTQEEWAGFLAASRRVDLAEAEIEGLPDPTRSFVTRSNADLVAALRQKRGGDRLLMPLAEEVSRIQEDGSTVWVVARSPGSAQRLRDLLEPYGLALPEAGDFDATPAGGGGVRLALGALERGFRFPVDRVAVVTETEILGEKVRRPAARRTRGLRSSLGDVVPGDPLVHEDFGIALYRGLVRLDVAEEEGDYLLLEYDGGDRLYLPVTRIGLVRPYSSPSDAPPRLDKLGGKSWPKARGKAIEGIEKMASELLGLYARRQLAERPPYSPVDMTYREFAATFPYEETPHQEAAIDDVLRDLGSPRPMDRLICGDVGYGKTEVAIRAAFRAIMDGRQVAVLVPTTVLAAQHFQNFRKRFEGYPIVVEMMSRFVSAADQKAVRERIAAGAVDIVVGTHRLLQRDMKYKELGLVVVDEEHRFGVGHKERLKQLRARVDVLTLSATPIPRTLNMGLSGVRDLSVIETPPADRLAVRTTIAPLDDDIVREALQRELGRGGQVYFVHNRVQSIAAMAEYVRALVPHAKVGIGHGQMKERELERVMEEFVAGRIDILVCTAIIESGLDIPRANTIVINRADRFGLADLYQLRGRVGRSNLRAYAILLVPGDAELTVDARKRLQALQEFAELGAGFKIATHDLEIRGAGELLGKAQSGQMAAIGFDLYVELLEQAVRRRRGEAVEKPPEPELRLRVAAHFPVEYVEDAAQRLQLYERLTRVASEPEIEEIRYELIDRYGALPPPAENLLQVMKIRRALVALRATNLDYSGKELSIAFDQAPAVDPDRVLHLVQSEPARYRLTPDHRLIWATGPLAEGDILERSRDLLKQLG